MSTNINNIISKYKDLNGLQFEQEALPPLPGEVPAVPDVAQPEVKTMTDEAYVTAVKTMIELLSYGLNANEDVAHREPVSKWLKMKNEVNKGNAFEVAQEIDDFLGNEE